MPALVVGGGRYQMYEEGVALPPSASGGVGGGGTVAPEAIGGPAGGALSSVPSEGSGATDRPG